MRRSPLPAVSVLAMFLIAACSSSQPVMPAASSRPNGYVTVGS